MMKIVLLLLVLCLQGQANAQAGSTPSREGTGDSATRGADSAKGFRVQEAKKGTPPLPVIEAECLKEGESCNVVMDRCCPGYSCQGGLAATCVRVTR